MVYFTIEQVFIQSNESVGRGLSLSQKEVSFTCKSSCPLVLEVLASNVYVK